MRCLVVAAVLSATLLANGAIAEPGCGAYGNCEVCTQSASEGCGWCDGACTPGKPSGPTTPAACHSKSWYWHDFSCPAPTLCSQYHTCSECGSAPGCGFCGDKCLPGTSSGPTGAGQCGAAHWYFGGVGCPTAAPTPRPRGHCAAHNNCGMCTGSAMADCGWCDGQCYEGGESGPTHDRNCHGDTWHYFGDHCPTPAPTAPGCHDWTSCLECTRGPSSTCGWCDGKCRKGSSSGPTSGTCHGDHWHWEGDHCPTAPPTPMPPAPSNNCDSHMTCFGCTSSASGNCGWCNGTCFYGTSSGPVGGSCGNDAWHWQGNNCPTAPPPPADCRRHTTCSGCTQSFSGTCGFCDGECHVGTSSGPTNGTCGSHTWHWEGNTCPTPPPTPMPPSNCGQWKSCTDCTNDASLGNCGWCNGTCHVGNMSGPSIPGQCHGSTWHWLGDNCPIVTPAPTSTKCDSFLSCIDCTRGPSEACGWCDGKCRKGNSSGPMSGTCDSHPWHWEGAHCPTQPPTPMPASHCSHHTTCNGCTTMASPGNCGWCDGGCFEGTANGPSSSGACDGHSWHYYNCPINCSLSSSCDSCTENSGCGWCTTSHKCESGSSSGPSHGTCSSTDWHYNGFNCPTPVPPPADCQAYDTCNSCTLSQSGRCGFCSKSRQCFQGTHKGPLNGTCIGDDWQWYNSNCPV